MDEPTSVSELLQRAQLQQYVAAFEEQGYDSLSQLHGITDEDLTELIADVNMKKGHVKRLLEALGRKGSAGGSSTAPAAPATAMPAAAQPQPAAPENAGQHDHVPPSAATNMPLLSLSYMLPSNVMTSESAATSPPVGSTSPLCSCCTSFQGRSRVVRRPTRSANNNSGSLLYRYSVARAAAIQRRIQENCCITRVTALYSGGSSSHGFV